MSDSLSHHHRFSTRSLRRPLNLAALGGGLLVLLGLWGGLVPFVGPEFGYAYTPGTSWTWTWGRLWLNVLPALAVILGGLGTMGATTKTTGGLSGGLAALAGAWFVVGPVVSTLWPGGIGQSGAPSGTSTLSQVVQEIGFHSGLGVVIVFLAALVLGRAAASITPAGTGYHTHEDERL